MNNNILLVYFFRLLPKSLFSRLFGMLTRIRLPEFIIKFIINRYINFYKLDADEILIPENGFRTVDQFFTRQLNPGVHIIDNERKSVVSPVDARIDQFGQINGNKMIQAKGIEYSVFDLVPSAVSENFVNGSYITLYLSPADYHRIHSPVTGIIAGCFHIPGKLFPVQEVITANVKKLFSINERLITYIRTHKGLCAVCMIGAMNVGRISLNYSGFVANKTKRKKTEVLYSKEKQSEINKGGELGIFHLGSTVILLFQKNMVRFREINAGQKIRLGQAIADYID